MIRWMRNPTGPVRVAEWYKTADQAYNQANGYTQDIDDATDHQGLLWLFGSYKDTYYRGPKCDEGDSGKVDGWSYDVLASGPGVDYIVIPRSGVTGRN